MGLWLRGPFHRYGGPLQLIRPSRPYATKGGTQKLRPRHIPLPLNKLTDEQKHEKILEMHKKSGKPSDYDIQSQQIPAVFDMHIPHSIMQTCRIHGIKGPWRWLVQELMQWCGNAINLHRAVQYAGMPGILRRPSRFSPKALGTRSTRRGAWVAKLREVAKSRYIEFNEARARGDHAVIRKLASEPLVSQTLDRMKKYKGLRMEWKFITDRRPTQCLSIRSIPNAGLGHPPPRAGMQQVLIRFETHQTLAIYDRKGKLLQGNPTQVNTVKDYMIFEHRNWAPEEGWKLKAQVYETNID
ncbi:hypothetical protein BS47DRAFT_1389723 [Hydnum rufescens UP504]|uniref:Large ribosomal subunit protein mL45 n=1 Tax=Hydnum rufescens UP504 TaxID=1448309 RepID=A0A9P6B4A2_9AGAM|nr:hypothetical protein BS47DRAFT_1389723 [Hydnum rufescens UP504]